MQISAVRFLLILTLACFTFTGCYSRVRDTGYLKGGYGEFNAIEVGFFKLRFDENSRYAPAPTHERKLQKIDKKTGKETFVPLPVADDETTRALAFILPETKWLAAPYEVSPKKAAKETEVKDVSGATVSPDREKEVLFTIRERLYRYLLRSYPHPVRVRYAFSPTDGKLTGYRVITITSNVTSYSKGVGWMRYVFGWGAGEARIQIEGEILEGIGEGQVKIGEYVIRRGSGGFAQNGLNTKVLRADYCLKYAADEAILTFTQQLPYLMQGVETMKMGRINATNIYLKRLDDDNYATALEQVKSFMVPLDDSRRPIIKKTFSNSPVIFSREPGFGK
ncbi:hypothetical protein IT570_11330 [Candidatus Sumerlaeota bacterium]|nr:hypothetical protein [Candidatus Sumerlaeota bacterium]